MHLGHAIVEVSMQNLPKAVLWLCCTALAIGAFAGVMIVVIAIYINFYAGIVVGVIIGIACFIAFKHVLIPAVVGSSLTASTIRRRFWIFGLTVVTVIVVFFIIVIYYM